MRLDFLFLTCAILTNGCSPSENAKAADNSLISEHTKTAFNDAGLPLLREKRPPAQWTLKNLNGENVSLEALKGKVVFINFWATWCPPCRGEMASMDALYNRLKDKGFEMIACDIMEDADAVREFIRSHKLSFPVVLDSGGKVSESYNVQGIPATFIIDRDGMLILRTVGGRNWNTPQIYTAFEALLDS